MRRSLFAGAAFAVAQLVAGSVSADPPPDDAVAKWEAAVAKKLGLDANQSTALHAYAIQLATKSSTDPPLDEDHVRAMSLPQRLDWMTEHAEADSALLRARTEGARRLYATLSADQQRQFDELTLPNRRAVTAPLPAQDDAPPPPANYRLPSHTEPSDLTVSVDALSRLYPSAAAPKHLLGKVLLRCAVDVDGYLSDCVVVSETPPGEGFGNAGLEATAYMRMRPATNYGVPVRSQINVPLSFEPP